MAESEKAYLLRCYEQGICPCCGKPVESGTPVGSGKKDEGRFCSLSCQAEYHQREFVERHKKRLEQSRRQKHECD